MTQRLLPRLSALLLAAGAIHCGGQPDAVPLISAGDVVHVLPMSAVLPGSDGCPPGWNDVLYPDESNWNPRELPLRAADASGMCLRKTFNVGVPLSEYRWLKVSMSSGTQGLLAGSQRGHIFDPTVDWDSHDTPSERAGQMTEYTVDLQVFKDVLTEGANVLALQLQPHAPGLNIDARLVRQSAPESQLKVVKGPYTAFSDGQSARVVWETNRPGPTWLRVTAGGVTSYVKDGWNVYHSMTVRTGFGIDKTLPQLVPNKNYQAAVFTTTPCDLIAPPTKTEPLSSPTLKPSGLATPDRPLAVTTASSDDPASCLTDKVNGDPAMGMTPIFNVRTAPADTQTQLSFAVVGDSHLGDDATRKLLTAVNGAAPSFVVHTGDLVRSPDDWQPFFDVAGSTLGAAPMYPAAGERDVRGQLDLFRQYFPLVTPDAANRSYSIDLGPVHLAVLDTTTTDLDLESQAAWLEADLQRVASSPTPRHVFVVMHWGPFSGGKLGSNPRAQARILPVLQRHPVDAVFSGHDAIYEHDVSAKLDYFVVGGEPDASDGPTAHLPTTLDVASGQYFLVVTINGSGVTVAPKKTAVDASGAVIAVDAAPMVTLHAAN